jgi:hypothetical protein
VHSLLVQQLNLSNLWNCEPTNHRTANDESHLQLYHSDQRLYAIPFLPKAKVHVFDISSHHDRAAETSAKAV